MKPFPFPQKVSSGGFFLTGSLAVSQAVSQNKGSKRGKKERRRRRIYYYVYGSKEREKKCEKDKGTDSSVKRRK